MSIVELLEEFGDWVRQAMHYVTSADKAYHWLRGQGLEVTRDLVREVWREVGIKEQWYTVIQTWGNERPIPSAWIVDKETKEAEGLLQYVMAQWYNPETGEIRYETHSRHIDEIVAFSDYVEEIEDLEELYAEWSGYKLIGLYNAGVVRMTPKGK